MQELYDRYSKGLRRCVDRVYADGSDADLADRFRANVSRFAAYKADYVKTTVSNILNDASIPLKQRQEMADAAVAGFDRYSEAECNTATSRCRTAKQWKEFNDPQRLRLFPNLRWLPSRSAVIRATHEKFYDKVWPKGDDFWNTNLPGQEWNCKCDLEETDDPVTDNSDVKTVPVPKGLEGNPSVTGEIFTDKAGYISKGNKQRVEKFWKPIEEGFETYRQYRDDANYEDVKMNWDNGGMKATHKGHKFDKVGGEYEKQVQNVGFNNRHRVVLEDETDYSPNIRHTEGIWDSRYFEIAGRETATCNNILRGLKHCANKKKTEIAILYYPNGGFDLDLLERAIGRYKGLENVDNGNQFLKFKKIICIQGNEIVYNEPL